MVTFLGGKDLSKVATTTNPVPAILSNGDGEITDDNPLQTTQQLKVTTVIEDTAYDLNAAVYSETATPTFDYLIDSVTFDFSTTESRTITITSDNGTKLYEATNTNLSVAVTNINFGQTTGQSFTVAITQTSGACTVDVTANIKNSPVALTGDPVTASGSRTSLQDTDNNDITVQNPLPSDGDSVYVKDINTTYSDNGDFSGSVTDYFDSLKTVNEDTTSNNPKTIKVWFNRTVYARAIGLGCDDLTKNFGNSVTLELLGSGEVVRRTVTSTGDTNSRLIQFAPSAFNGFNLKFNTASSVGLSNITIRKETASVSRIQGEDSDGNIQNVKTTIDGNLAISDNSSGLSIAEGNVTNHSFIHKFGAAPDFDVADGFVTVWDGADDSETWAQMNYTYSTTADIDRVSSTSASDTFEIEVQGLDSNYDLTVQTVTLTGQTPVALTTSLIRVFRMKNVNTSDNVGHVFCFVNVATTGGVPNTPANIRAVMQPGNNQTLMAIYTIPNGKTGYMRDWYASTAGAKRDSQHSIELRARPFGQVFQLKHLSNISVTGTSYIQHQYTEPEVFAAKTDIEVRMDTDTDIAGVSAGFDIVLIDN